MTLKEKRCTYYYIIIIVGGSNIITPQKIETVPLTLFVFSTLDLHFRVGTPCYYDNDIKYK